MSTFNDDEGRGGNGEKMREDMLKFVCFRYVIFVHVIIISLEYLNEFQNLTTQMRDIEL